jgi:serine/threonine-protein kinase RsbW
VTESVEHPMPAGQQDTPDGATVALRVPAESAYVAVLRSVTAGLAARCDLTLDEIEDLRIAVDEACALLLPMAAAGTALSADFTLSNGELVVRASLAARRGAELNQDGFGWTVLDALASSVVISDEVGQVSITLTKTRDAAGAAGAADDTYDAGDPAL